MWVTVITQLLSFVTGLAGQYLPDWLKGKQEDAREERMAKLMQETERIKASAAGDKAYADRETLEAIQSLQLEMTDIKETVKNQSAAREFGIKIVSMLDQTLSRGKELGVNKNWLTCGWLVVLLLEAFSASIQPAIGAIVITFWAICKMKATGGVVWGMDDWCLLEVVVGFWLGGRLKKAKAAKNAGE